MKTTYYTVDIPIWVDEIEDDKEGEWSEGYLTKEAKEVLKVLGGFILTFLKPRDAAGLVWLHFTLERMGDLTETTGSDKTDLEGSSEGCEGLRVLLGWCVFGCGYAAVATAASGNEH